jgi:hypothetical protein
MSSSSVGNNSLSSKGKKRRSQGTNWMQMATNPLTWTSTLAAIFFILTIRYQFAQSTFLKNADARNLAQALVMIRSARTEQDHLRSELRTLKESYKAAVNTNSQRDGEVQKLRAQIRELSEKSNPHHHAIVQQQEEQLQMHASEKAHMTLREQALKTQVESLKQAASRESSRTVTERYVLLRRMMRRALGLYSFFAHASLRAHGICCAHF